MNNSYNMPLNQKNKTGMIWLVIGLVSLVAGLICLIVGINKNSSLESQMSSYFSNGTTDPGTPLIVVGAVCLAIGVVMVIVGIYMTIYRKPAYDSRPVNIHFNYNDSLKRMNELKAKGLISEAEYSEKLVQINNMFNENCILQNQQTETECCCFCGEKITDGSTFCIHCGNKLEG